MPATPRPPLQVTAADGLLDPAAYVTIAEAAVLAAVSEDRVKRLLRKGAFPGAHRLLGDRHGRWVFSLADVAASGLISPARVSPTPGCAGTSLASVTTMATDVDQARLQAENASLRETLAYRDDEIAFLRSLLRPGQERAA